MAFDQRYRLRGDNTNYDSPQDGILQTTWVLDDRADPQRMHCCCRYDRRQQYRKYRQCRKLSVAPEERLSGRRCRRPLTGPKEPDCHVRLTACIECPTALVVSVEGPCRNPDSSDGRRSASTDTASTRRTTRCSKSFDSTEHVRYRPV